ncbi:MAG: hypothetical protein AB1529_07020 [Candidatus Micrarchaeota archaeon]
MDLRIFFGLLAVALLLGCLAGPRTGAPQKPALPGQPAQPAPGIGDSEISPEAQEDDDVLADEDLVPPPAESSGTALDASDIDVEVFEDDVLISEEDVVEPG